MNARDTKKAQGWVAGARRSRCANCTHLSELDEGEGQASLFCMKGRFTTEAYALCSEFEGRLIARPLERMALGEV